MQCHGLQCGFCTPGMLMTARRLLDHDPDPSEADDPRGHLGPVLPLHRLREHRAGRPLGGGAPVGATGADEGADEPDRAGGGDGMTAADRRRRHRPSARPGNPIGFGRMLRKEDARFLRGQGNYLDDIQLPGDAPRRHPPQPDARTPASSPSTPRRPRPIPRSRPSSPAPSSRPWAWRGCPRCRATSRPCWPPTRCGSRARRSRSSSPRTATRPATPSSSSTSTTRRSTGRRRPPGARQGAPVIRDDIEGKADNHIFDWESGDGRAATRCSPVPTWS